MEHIQISPLIQNILWCAAGIIGAIVIIKLLKKPTPEKPVPTLMPQPEVPVIAEEPISVIQHPQGNAKEAFLANIKKLAPLFDCLNNGSKFSGTVNDAIIEINNKELMNLWTKICNNHKAVLRVLAMWGIKREDEIQFQAQKHHIERYDLTEGQSISLGKTYKMIYPCWIYTSINSNGVAQKSVAIKGLAQEL